MGYADFKYPQYEAKAVTVIADGKTGKVEIYRADDNDTEWYEPNEKEHFYPTVEEADAALKQHRQELIDRMDEVRDYVDAMNGWLCEIDENSPFQFEESDYLPYRNQGVNLDDSVYIRQRDRARKQIAYLLSIIRTGFINIEADSFRMEDVKQIMWGKDKAEIILTDGRKAKTCSRVEFYLIRNLFGDNNSGATYDYLSGGDSDD